MRHNSIDDDENVEIFIERIETHESTPQDIHDLFLPLLVRLLVLGTEVMHLVAFDGYFMSWKIHVDSVYCVSINCPRKARCNWESACPSTGG